MRFVSFHCDAHAGNRFGLMTANGLIADVETTCAAMLAREMPVADACKQAAKLAPHDALAFIAAGDVSLGTASRIVDFLRNRDDPDDISLQVGGKHVLFAPNQVQLLAPVPRPRKFIAAGKNFSEHMAEMSGRIPLPRKPVAFAQMATTIVGPDKTIPYPKETQKLDYEVEVAVVIGKPAYRVETSTARDHIFGYTIFNDISARDIYRDEQASGIPLLGKNLPAFAPMGPALCTRDEFNHLPETRLQMRVNGETRQNGTLASMIFGIDELIAYWSQIGLEPGDILTTGTPSGVAAGRKADEAPWWLKPSDILEAEVTGLGILRNAIGPMI